MLAYILAIVVAIGSFSFYMAAFFVPEMHRRQDFLWSGLGMFYAVVLWFCAGRITGAVLLGQIVSVALLGGLGWHTLALRRDLTPAPVRTPIEWSDVEQGWQSLQRFVNQQLQLGSAVATVQSLGASVTQQIASLRQKTAGPRGLDAEVPPLQRSPAYEFETETGTGDVVPSEFATVSTEERQTAEARDRAANEEAAATSNQTQDESTAAPPPVVEAELIEEPVPSEGVSAAGSSQRGQATRSPVGSPAKPSPTSTAGAASAKRFNPVAGATSWVGDLMKGWRKPKPQRGVVEIPARPPSIPRSPATDADPSDAVPSSPSSPKVKPSRGVIDIPPRPPSIPRSPKSDTEPNAKESPKRGRQSKPQRGVIDIPPRPPSIPRSPKPDPTPSTSSPESPAADDTNWVDVGDTAAETTKAPESNRNEVAPRSSAPAPSPAATPAPPTDTPPPKAEPDTNWTDDEPETNWPDDDDTNWPD